ncbi:hypothetical protein Tco_1215749 [Tanacetum coccineum]
MPHLFSFFLLLTIRNNSFATLVTRLWCVLKQTQHAAAFGRSFSNATAATCSGLCGLLAALISSHAVVICNLVLVRADEHNGFALTESVMRPHCETAQKEDCRFGGKLSKLQNEEAQDETNIQEPRKLWPLELREVLFLIIMYFVRKYLGKLPKLHDEVAQNKDEYSGSSEGSGTTPEVPDEPKDNSAVVAEKQVGYVQTNLTLSSAKLEIQSMVDVPIHQEDLAVQRTPLIDPVISMVTEKTASTPTPPTTQAHWFYLLFTHSVLCYFESLRFEKASAAVETLSRILFGSLPDSQAEKGVSLTSRRSQHNMEAILPTRDLIRDLLWLDDLKGKLKVIQVKRNYAQRSLLAVHR